MKFYVGYLCPNTTSRSLKKNHLAVVLIDMQSFFLPDVEIGERGKVILNQAEVIRYCAQHDIPLVVLEIQGMGKTYHLLKKEIEKVPRVKTITKTSSDGFTEPELLLQLKKWDIETILLTGINAGACVLETGESAIKNGFKIATSEDLIAESERHYGNKFIPWYENNGICEKNLTNLLVKLQN